MIKRYYTGVGSRETPKHILELMSKVAYHLADAPSTALGLPRWVLRSGAAGGADAAFEDGVFQYAVPWCDMQSRANIYLPWQGFSDKTATGSSHYIDTPSLPNYKEAELIASKVHPAWDKCKRGARALHTRNVYQVLGNDLASPSAFLICYATPVGSSGVVKGGTNTAVQLALQHGVKVHNLFYPEVQDKLQAFTEK